MPFYPPSYVPALPFSPPDSISLPEFLFEEQYGRQPYAQSRPAFTSGLDGSEVSATGLRDKVEALAKGLGRELGWKPNVGTEWDKVVGVFSLNTIDTLSVSWAAHRLGGISTPANAAYSTSEVAYQMKTSGATVLFTCAPLLDTALTAAKECGISKDKIYLIEVAEQLLGGKTPPKEFKTVSQLVKEGEGEAPLEKLNWKKGDGAKKVAFLCYSSGTSGLPKGVMISHRNVIANTMQITAWDKPSREILRKERGAEGPDISLGLLPFNHIYALVWICNAGVYRGDQTIVLPKFEMKSFLQAIAAYKIRSLFLVPPILIQMAKNSKLCTQYNLSSVHCIFTGAAPLGQETADDINRIWPSWYIRQGYGMTESSTVTCSTSINDIDFGSSGVIVPGVEMRLVTPEGHEIEGYEQPGELLVKSPSVVLGYLNNEEATRETFQGEWLRTGDEAIIKKSPKGYEHVWIVDRIKELIKVKGLQVAPAELEAHLLTNEYVADCAVIPVPDDRAGEVPKAFVVRASTESLELSDALIKRQIKRHVEKHKSRAKWLDGGVEFVAEIPKSASGKILRRMLRDKERERRRKEGAKM